MYYCTAMNMIKASDEIELVSPDFCCIKVSPSDFEIISLETGLKLNWICDGHPAVIYLNKELPEGTLLRTIDPDYVEGKINNAEQRENKSKQILSDAEKVLSDSKKEAIEIVEQAKNDALKQKEIILNQAKEETKIEKQKLKNEIAQEIESSKDEIHHQIVDVALSASEKVLNREVSKEDNSRLVDEFIKSLDKDE